MTPLEIILAIAPTIVDHTIGPLMRHAGYAFCYARKVAELKNQVQKLAATRKSLQNYVDAAISRGDEIQPTVEKWLTDAENAIKEAWELTEREEEEATTRCFAGGCPNLKTRYQIGKQAAKNALAIQELDKEGKIPPSQLSYRVPPPQIVSSSAHGFEGLPSRASIFKEVMEALTDPNPNVNMIGVYGMAGTGKTTLAKEVHKQAIEGKLFDVVAMTTLSVKPELKEIQGKIADVLGLKLEEETIDGRANRLRQILLKKNKVLIILDNLWEKIELEELGIPLTNDKWVKGRGADSVREGFQFNSQLQPIERKKNYLNGCKLLITSRNRHLLADDMGVHKEVMLDVLGHEESWTLFERTVGGIKIPRLQSIASEVAEKCAGLPILLVTVASALKNKEYELWKDALNRLSTSQDEEIQKKVYSGLELSYDYLPDEEVKSFFLLCGIFTYSDIFIMNLLKYSMGLGLLKRVHTVEDARMRVHKLIGDLKDSCLLSESEMDGRVKIHDVVRDVAASIAKRAQFAFKKVGGELEEFKSMDITSCARIYLEDCDVSMLSLKSQCPAVEFFYLHGGDLSLKIPDSFFEGITKLQVLDFTSRYFSSLPLSLGSLTSLHTLCLDFCRLEDISVLMQLKNLEILSLWGSYIDELPSNLAQLTQLKLLDLRNCSKLKFIPENVLSQLSLLEELLMGDSFVNWDVKGLHNQSNASLSELERLSRLTCLEIQVLDSKKLPKGLFSRKLERYMIFIGDEWDWRGKYQTSRTLKLKLDTSIHSKHGLKTLLKDVEDLYLDEVKGITNVLYDLHREGFPQLKHLHVQNGREIRHIIDSKRWVSCYAFPLLESLILHNLVSLDKISRGKLLAGDFGKLKTLKVSSCSRLKNLLPFSMVRKNLQQLGEMEIIDCNDMEVIFADENEEEEGDDKNRVVEFTQLYSLKLQLPLLQTFCSKGKGSPASATASSSRQKQSAMDPPFMEIESACDTSMPLFDEMIVFPNLKKLELSSIGVDKIWHRQFPDQRSFCKLTSLTVETCKNLNYLFTSWMVQSLAQLQKLEISDCRLMEDVIATEGEIIGKTPFANLEFLKLKGLPTLGRFCVGGLIEFPSLKELWIEDCLQLKSFISNPIAGNAGSNLALLDKKVSFPKLEELRIINMDGLKMIWHNELHGSSFCKIKSVIVQHANELQYIFPSNMLMTRFLNLESLELVDCALLKEVFNLQIQALINSGTYGSAASRLKKLTIQNMPNLKHIWNKHPQEREIISFSDLQVVYVSKCPNLKRVFPTYIAMSLLQLEELELKSCGIQEIVEGNEEIEVIARFEFPKLITLTFYNLRELTTLYPGLHTSEWPMLKYLDVHDCGKMEIFTSESGCFEENSWRRQLESPLHQPFFSVEKVIPNLEELTLTNKDVQMMHDSEFPADLFGEVRFLHLQLLDKKSASSLFTFLRRFRSLEKLEVIESWLQDVFSCEQLIAEEKGAGRTIPRIQHLRLHFLYNLKSVWKDDCQLEQIFENVKTLEVWGCDSLISLAPSAASFGSLTHLDVWKCQGLLNLVTSSTARYLRHLDKLGISECDMMEEIVGREEDYFEDHFIWCSLRSLKLHCLPNLTCFSSACHTFEFPSLEEVIVAGCPKIKAFSGGDSIAPNLCRVKLGEEEDDEWRWKDDLNTTIQQLCAELVGLRGIKNLVLSEFPELKEIWHKENFPTNLVFELRSLAVDECVSYSSAVPSNLLRSLNNLAELEVKNCDSVEEVFDLTLPNAADEQIGTLPKLNKLQLIHLPSLKHIWKEKPEGVFHLRNLKVVKISNCSTLRYVFTPTVCCGLVRLEELEVRRCPLIEEIIRNGAASEKPVGNFTFPLLNSVFLECLPNLTSFCSASGTVQFPSLKNIAIIECSSTFSSTFLNECPPFDASGSAQAKIGFPNLKELKMPSIGVDNIWRDQFALLPSFDKLTSLTVEACWNLNYLFTSSRIKGLAQLQKLQICDCKSMEDVIATEGEIVSGAPFPNLEFLKLKGLPMLSTFCIGGLIEFPYLKELWIEDCLELKAFISNFVAANTTSNLSLFDEKVALPKLEELRIVNMDGLKMIWPNELHDSSFCNLKSIIVEHAEELLNIFPSNMLMSRLLNLEHLELNNCALLEEVFNLQLQALIDSRTQGLAASRLKTLRIQNLPNLKHIWNKHPQEREIISFTDLQEVYAFKCPNLKRVFPTYVAMSLLQLEELELKSCGIQEIVERDEETEVIARFEFPKLTTLTFYNLRELTMLYQGSHTSEWPMLKYLDVLDCDKMEIFTSESGCFEENSWGRQLENPLHRPFFSVEKVIPNLEELTLTNKDVQMMHDAEFPAELFDNVRFLHLELLDEKSASFLFALLRRFRNLETLEVINNELQEVFSRKELIDEKNQGSTVARVRHLRLKFLYNLTCIWKQDCQSERMFENLENLEVWCCDSLFSLAPAVAPFRNLSHLYVWKCEGLLNLVTSSTFQHLRHLTKLGVSKCNMVKEVVAREEGHDEEDQMITWGNLRSLKLHCLASLTCFSSAYHTFKFPSLEEVIVTGCPKIKAFSLGVSITPKLRRVKLGEEEDDEWRWQDDLNTTIQQLCAELVGLRGIKNLVLSEFPELKETWHKEIFPANFLSELRSLAVDDCVSYSSAVPSNLLRSLNNLAELEVKNCDSVEEVFGLTLPNAADEQIGTLPKLNKLQLIADEQIGTLPKLNKLQLIHLPSLKHIWKEQPEGVFHLRNLKVVKISNCSTLRYVFTPTVCCGLVRLEELEVRRCPLIEEIIRNGAASEKPVGNFTFPLLNSVFLECLPNLTSFCSASSTVQFPSLKNIAIIECSSTFSSTFLNECPPFDASGSTQAKIGFPNLKELKMPSIGVDNIWRNQFAHPPSFDKLTSLTVEACWNLNYLFTSSTIKSLAQLQKLEIYDCKSMEDVIATEGEIVSGVPFPNLEFLKLKGLPMLSTFCIGGLIEFPYLKELWIEDCLELKSFISNFVAANTASNLSLFNEKVAFPKLEELRIVNMDRLKMIWHNELHDSSFCNLKSIIVEHAEELLNIFPSNILISRLLNLEHLELNDCALLEEVFNLQLQALVISRTEGMAASRLKTLMIQNLPNLKYIWNKHPKEREFISFNDLQEVYAFNCPNLKRVFPTYIAMGLLQLENLGLKSCGIEEIVERDEDSEAIPKFEFPKLTGLKLYILRKLTTLYPGMHTSEWPMLKSLDVYDCGEMEIFTSEIGSLQENSWGKQLENPRHRPFFSIDKVIPNLEELTLTSKDAQSIWDGQFEAHVFDKVTNLHLECFDEISASFLLAFLRRFRNLEKLELRNNELQELFSCEGPVSVENQGSIVARHMKLRFLFNLKTIWKQGCLQEQMFEDLETLEVWKCDSLLSLAPSVASFGKLSHLDVWKCQGLLNLVTSSTAKYVRHLTRLSIRGCDVLEEIVTREEDYDREDQMITWGNLKTLKLHCLASLTCFSSAYHTFKFPSLEEVIVTECPKMETFSRLAPITPKLKLIKQAEDEEDDKGRWEGDLNTTIQQLYAELTEDEEEEDDDDEDDDKGS